MESDRPHFADPKGIKLILRALYHRNFRLFFGGQGISLIGTWMQQIAISWLTYRLTHSTVLLGVVGFLSMIPTFLLAPFTGVLVDRWDRHRILMTTQILAMIQAMILALLVLTDMITIWHIIILSTLLGFVNSIDNPARQSFIIDIIEDKDDLSNAIALSASLFNAARLVGPSIAGILIALVGEGICFLLNGVSFIAVIISLWAMKIAPTERKTQSTPLWRGMKEGFAYAFGFPPIRAILILVAWGNLTGTFYSVLMPVFARDVLHGGAHSYGFLMAAAGCGALAGTIYLASRKSVLGLGRVLAVTSLLSGVGLILFSLSHVLWLSLFFMLLTGFGMISQFSLCNTALQTIVENDKRGRVMSLFLVASVGMMPFGSLLAGSLAHIISAQTTILLSGISCILGAVMVAIKLPSMRTLIRPIYVKKGIIVE